MSQPRALENIRVVDFSWVRAGPWATRWLGALGARTRTAEMADLHIAPRPGTDAALSDASVALLARACDIAGQVEETLSLLNNALQVVARIGERWFAAELYRHKGQLMLRHENSEAAEKLYRQALTAAKEQEAKLWELRAAASLARLRRDQGRRAEARDLLAPVYGWFIEGFDTPDLKEAKALLDTLDGP